MNKTKVVIMLAEIFGEKMTESRVRGYLDMLRDLSDEEVYAAYVALGQNDKIYRMPTPGQIRQAARPTISPRDAAISSVNRVLRAVKRWGYTQGRVAQENLSQGEWTFVESRGGWSALCCDPENNLNDPTIYAQMRDQLAARYTAKKIGFEFEQLSGDNTHNRSLESGDKQNEVLKKLNHLLEGVKNE